MKQAKGAMVARSSKIGWLAGLAGCLVLHFAVPTLAQDSAVSPASQAALQAELQPAPTTAIPEATAGDLSLPLPSNADGAVADESVDPNSLMPDTSGMVLGEEVQAIKELVLELNRDLFILEEELLYPASTQVAIFVSVDVGKFFQVDAVELRVDGKKASAYLYTERQADALYKGGVQRLYVGNVRQGNHRITAIMTGKGPHDRDYRLGAALEFDKETEAKMLELRIRDSGAKLQPEMTIVEWQ